MNRFLFPSTLALALLLSGLAVHAGPIRRVPVKITKPGKYYLIANLVPAATNPEFSAITIDADNVELDLGGFTIANNPANPNFVNGIFVLGKEGIRIRNGRIRDFTTGIQASGDVREILFENLEIKSPASPVSSSAKGSHFRHCTFVLGNAVGNGLDLSAAGGGPAHIVEFCTFYATALGMAASQRGVTVTSTQPAVVRNCQFFGFGLGISGNNATAAADNLFMNCTSKLSAGVTNVAGYNQ